MRRRRLLSAMPFWRRKLIKVQPDRSGFSTALLVAFDVIDHAAMQGACNTGPSQGRPLDNCNR
jgi:hypothetical protein